MVEPFLSYRGKPGDGPNGVNVSREARVKAEESVTAIPANGLAPPASLEQFLHQNLETSQNFSFDIGEGGGGGGLKWWIFGYKVTSFSLVFLLTSNESDAMYFC